MIEASCGRGAHDGSHERSTAALSSIPLEIVDAQRTALAVGDVRVVRGEWKVRQRRESIVGSAKRVHRRDATPDSASMTE